MKQKYHPTLFKNLHKTQSDHKVFILVYLKKINHDYNLNLEKHLHSSSYWRVIRQSALQNTKTSNRLSISFSNYTTKSHKKNK